MKILVAVLIVSLGLLGAGCENKTPRPKTFAENVQ